MITLPVAGKRIGSPRRAAVAEAVPYRFSVDMFRKMFEAGILNEGEHWELIEGLIYRNADMNPPHCNFMAMLHEWLVYNRPKNWHVRSQSSSVMGDSAPEPDLYLVRGKPADYPDRLPEPADIGLLIEVADSTLAFDRKTKLELYARSFVPAYWIVNVRDAQIEEHSQPEVVRGRTKYNRGKIYKTGSSVPLILDGVEVARLNVADLFG